MGTHIDPIVKNQVLALGEIGVPSGQIASMLGVPRSTVGSLISRHSDWGQVAEGPVARRLRLEQQKILEVGYRQAAAETLARALDAEKLDKASTYQLSIASKIFLESSRLLAGESTQNIEVHTKVDVSGLAALATALTNTVQVPDNTEQSKS